MFGVGIGIGVGRHRFAGNFADSYSERVLADGGTIESLSCVASASTLLQQASILFIPSGYKEDRLYSVIPSNGDGDLTLQEQPMLGGLIKMVSLEEFRKTV